jgi:glycosyltransferase involved in cell wall biosynthesis
MSSPKVSVVVAAFNAEAYLRETLDCLLAQTYPNLEIVLVDDGSTDCTSEIAREAGEKVRVINQDNRGVSYARNVGLAHVEGEFVHFMDADDLLSPDFYELLAKPLVEDPGLDATYCAEEAFEGEWNGRNVLWRTDKSEYEKDAYTAVLLSSNLSPANVLYRAASIAFVGGFDTTLKTSEDYDFQLRFVRFCKMRRVPEAVYYYRRHPRSASRDYAAVYRNRLAVAKRHIVAFDGMDHRRNEWKALRRMCAVEACATMRFNLKRNLRNGPGFRRELAKALRFLASTPTVACYLLSGRRAPSGRH